MFRYKFGKEYELSFNSSMLKFKPFHPDGSGPTEIVSPLFRSIPRAILFEASLEQIFENKLYDYYIRRNGAEEKGNHFHIGIQPYEDTLMYRIYLIIHLYQNTFISKLHNFQRYRNTVEHWASRTLTWNYDRFKTVSRSYSYITTNRKHRNTHLELRASEASVVLDFAWFSIIYYTMIKFKNYTIPQLIHLNKINDQETTTYNQYDPVYFIDTIVDNIQDLYDYLNVPIKSNPTITKHFEDQMLYIASTVYYNDIEKRKELHQIIQRGFIDFLGMPEEKIHDVFVKFVLKKHKLTKRKWWL